MKASGKASASVVSAIGNTVDVDKQARTWGMLLHLSMFIPLLGLFAPIAIWQIKKDQLPGIDQHGKNAVNWIITEFIGLVILSVLASYIGVLPFYAVYITGIVFCVMAAVKANKGEIWKYPLAFAFLK